MKTIIQKYHYKIEQIIKNFTGSYNEDLEQEVYIKVNKNLDKYQEKNKFSQWICAITSNLCRDYLRSSKVKNDKNTSNSEEELINIKDYKTPENIYSSKERQKLILKEIDALPKKQREVIIYLEFEDLSYEQISKKLRIPVGTVKSRINTARKNLQEKLQYLLGD